MSEPFLGQITAFGFNFAPYQWMQCNGQILPISQYAALFSLLGTQFGGNGTSTFGLPNLNGVVPIGQGQGPGLQNYVMGETGGTPQVTLLATQVPAHTHSFQAVSGLGTTPTPATGQTLGRGRTTPTTTPPNLTVDAYAPPTAGTAATLAQTALGAAVGGNQPHANQQPSLTINWCIAMAGVFPTRS